MKRKRVDAMILNIRVVLAIAEIKAAIERFESGEDSATETLVAIAEACAAARGSSPEKRDAA